MLWRTGGQDPQQVSSHGFCSTMGALRCAANGSRLSKKKLYGRRAAGLDSFGISAGGEARGCSAEARAGLEKIGCVGLQHAFVKV